MGKISDIIRHNRLYAVLLVFIILINLLIFADWMAERSEKRAGTVVQGEWTEKETARPPEKKLFNEEDIKTRQKRLKDLAAERPLFYLFFGVLNLLILFAVFTGLILDIYFLTRWLRKKPLEMQLVEQSSPRWGIADIARVTLIFLSFGYIFVILQSLAVKFFPILYNENFHMIFNTAAMNIVGISVILYFVIGKYGQTASALGLVSKRISSGVFYAAVGYVTLIPVFLAIMVITFFVTRLIEYQPPVQPIVRVFMEEKETGVLWFSALFAAIFGPIAEEIFFRGFMYTAVRKKMGIFWAMVITSAIFAFLHTHIVGFLPIMALGMLLAFLYQKTGSLVAPISVHIMHNIAMVILVFLARSVGT